ncbi:hypothetical protein GOBAR_AA03779 [Gossypium barbadense]|uniref:Uncharacterized protein n=1 Tax=Gossypium barbadense TaxID=3634 RepID=A0A2P5YMF1_GOSBA|nr:hypothetical protein GOBAR_AA03779 [Gossypium barbadense]
MHSICFQATGVPGSNYIFDSYVCGGLGSYVENLLTVYGRHLDSSSCKHFPPSSFSACLYHAPGVPDTWFAEINEHDVLCTDAKADSAARIFQFNVFEVKIQSIPVLGSPNIYIFRKLRHIPALAAVNSAMFVDISKPLVGNTCRLIKVENEQQSSAGPDR